MEWLGKGKNLCTSAAKADMDEKTARKYRGLNKLPSEIEVDHTWRTREDPFDEVWEDVKGKLKILKRHFTVGFFSLDLSAMCVEHGCWLPS